MDELLKEALRRFETTLAEARASEPGNALAFALATSGRDARPSVRMVDLAGVVDARFAFFVDDQSGKGAQLRTNPYVGLCFYWPTHGWQVVVDGQVERLPDATADRLWRTRSRHQALAAWAPAPGERDTNPREQFADQRIPRAPNWIGYGVDPCRIEFWRARWRNVQDRVAYVRQDGNWRRAALPF